jgi:hypothetical protein
VKLLDQREYLFLILINYRLLPHKVVAVNIFKNIMKELKRINIFSMPKLAKNIKRKFSLV